MNISDSQGRPISGAGRPSGVAPAGGSGGNLSLSAAPSRTDLVQLSNLSAHLSAALGGSAAHLEKISSLSGAVLTGGYHIDTGAVSDSIIRHSLQFGSANYL
jgi:hypothetical protein